jgi:thioredoxin 1
MKKIILIISEIILVVVFISCKNNNIDVKTENRPQAEDKVSAFVAKDEESIKPMITFIELGSVNCIPCKMMQPVMKAIEKKYDEQVNVIFYDVWQQEQRHYAREFNIRVIPTQVFLDNDGNEIFRHEGFFPESEIDRFLQNRGLTPIEEG